MDVDVYERRRLNLIKLLQSVRAVDLAERSKVAATRITAYKKKPGERGSKRMTEDTARKLERAAGKPPRWLDELRAQGETDAPENAKPDKLLTWIATLAQGLDQNGREKLMVYAETLYLPGPRPSDVATTSPVPPAPPPIPKRVRHK